MAKLLSVDLLKRVIVAIEAGASCRQAATRFGVNASSAIRWHRPSNVEHADRHGRDQSAPRIATSL
jgi:transposase